MKLRLVDCATIACGAVIGFSPVLVPVDPQPTAAVVCDIQLPAILHNTWKVQTQRSIGSAWPIDENVFATAGHVVTGNPVVYLKNPAGEVVCVESVYVSPDLDLAFLFTTSELNPLSRSARIANPGDPVRAFGFPGGEHPAVSQGIVFGWRSEADEMMIDCGVLQGMSGGPVVNGCSEVIGMVVRCTLPPGRSMTFTLPIDTIMREYEKVKNAGRSAD